MNFKPPVSHLIITGLYSRYPFADEPPRNSAAIPNTCVLTIIERLHTVQGMKHSTELKRKASPKRAGKDFIGWIIAGHCNLAIGASSILSESNDQLPKNTPGRKMKARVDQQIQRQHWV
jgi:hypothetical protein